MEQREIIERIIMEGTLITPDFYIPENQKEFYDGIAGLFTQKKGVLLLGEYGCGKTLLMKICRKIFGFANIISTRHIMREFQIEGEKIIDIYGRNSFVCGQLGNPIKDRPINYCFDDLGLNDAIKNRYGNEINVMAEIISDRYEKFIDYKMKSYFTTNKTPEQIEKLYGDLVFDRLKQMSNLVIMPGKSLRK